MGKNKKRKKGGVEVKSKETLLKDYEYVFMGVSMKMTLDKNSMLVLTAARTIGQAFLKELEEDIAKLSGKDK